MCFSFPLTIDRVPRRFLSLWASPSPFAPAASAWPRTRREGRGGGATAVARSRLPAYVRSSESRAASLAEAAPPSGIRAKSGRAPFHRGVCRPGCSGRRWAPPVAGSSHWGEGGGCDSRREAPGELLPLCPRAGTGRGFPELRVWTGQQGRTRVGRIDL